MRKKITSSFSRYSSETFDDMSTPNITPPRNILEQVIEEMPVPSTLTFSVVKQLRNLIMKAKSLEVGIQNVHYKCVTLREILG